MEQRHKPISLPPILESDRTKNGFTRAQKPHSEGFIQPKRPEQSPLARAGLKCSISDELKLFGASALFRKMAQVLAYVHPESGGNTVYFKQDEILLGSKKIGDVSFEGGALKARIWFHNLGYPIGSLPPEDFQKFFKFAPLKYEEFCGSASYLAMMGVHSQGKSHLGLFFYKDFETRLREYFPYSKE